MERNTDLGRCTKSTGVSNNVIKSLMLPKPWSNQFDRSSPNQHSSQQLLQEANYVGEKTTKGGELVKPEKLYYGKRYVDLDDNCSCKPYENCGDNSESHLLRTRKEYNKNRRKSKTLKARAGKTRMVLGMDVTMDLVAQLSSCGLVGNFLFHNKIFKEAMNWLENSMTSFLGYSPILNFLLKGWHSITCRSELDMVVVLQRPWLWGNCSLVLKRWHPTFNPKLELFKVLHVWALLPGLPLQFWNRRCIEQ